MLRQLLRHTSNYSLGNILLVVAGLVSFPILTRLLSVDEYGLMSLVATGLTVLVGVGKMGMQNATFRFYSEIQAGKRELDMQAFVSTVMVGMGAMGLATTLLWAVASQLVPLSWWSDPRIRPLMLFTSVLILVRVFDSALVNQLRAQERSGVLLIYSVARRYASLGLLLAVLFYVAGNVWGFYAATIAGELLATLSMAAWMFRKGERPRPKSFSMPLFREMLAFGAPLIGYEVAAVVLLLGDRAIIQHMMGVDSLGVYSAVYNMCDYIKSAIFASLVGAGQPMVLRLWEQHGEGETVSFLHRFLTVYVMVAMLVTFGMAAIGTELLNLLASSKYVGGAPAIPYVMAGMAVETVIIITASGLYIAKRSKTAVAILVACTVLNLGLNVLLIPVLGLIGPAVSTLISCLVLLLAGALLGRRTFKMPLPLGAVLKFGAIGAVMYLAVMQIHLPGAVPLMVARMLAGFIIYGALTLALDRECRQGIGFVRDKLARKFGAR